MPIIDADGLFNGDRLLRCSREARLWWPYFFLASNGFGRVEIDYYRLAGRFLGRFMPPPTEKEVIECFAEYSNNFLIFLYEANGHLWGQWDTDQRFLPKYKTANDNRSPAPPPEKFSKWLAMYREGKQVKSAQIFEHFGNISKGFQEDSQNISEIAARVPHVESQQLEIQQDAGISEKFLKNSENIPETFRSGIGIGIGVGEVKTHRQQRSKKEPPPAAPPSPAVEVLPLRAGKSHTVTESDVVEFSRAYPAANVRSELRKMLRWLNEHEQNRKTPQGIRRFIYTWLGRANDSAPAVGAAKPKPVPTGPSASERERLRAGRGE